MRLTALAFLLLPLLTTAIRFLSPSTDLEIRNRISLYALAIDSKQYTLLNDVFATDVVADYLGAVYTGLPAVKAYISGALVGNTTQHALSTTVIQDNGKGANSTAYLVATYFGQGADRGKITQFYGKYEDAWGKEGGDWKIKRRTLTFFPSGIVAIAGTYPF